MKDDYRQARRTKYARQHRLDMADSPDAFPEEDEEIDGALTASDYDSLPAGDSTPDDMTADTLIGDPREEKPLPDDDEDEELRAPRHHWIHRKARVPGLRTRHPRH